MVYDSTINFVLDTICPFTYLAKKRLDMALEQVRAKSPPVSRCILGQQHDVNPKVRLGVI